MQGKSKIGAISLIVSILGLIAIQACIYYEILNRPFWHILLFGFEAATVGGIADWFAVSALFKEIPIPLIRRHTNIIVKNRDKLTEGVVDLVTNKWLSPEIIREKISGISISENIISVLQEPANKKRTLEFIGDILKKFSKNLDSPELVKVLQKILKEQLKGIDLAKPIGNWLSESLKNGDHYPLWDTVLASAKKTMSEPATHETVHRVVEKLIKDYKQENLRKKLFLGFVELVGAIKSRKITEKIILSIIRFLDDTQNDTKHPVRIKFDSDLSEFAQKLSKGEKEAVEVIEVFKNKLISNADAQPLILDVLLRFRKVLDEQLTGLNTPLMELIQRNVDNLLKDLETDRNTQDKIDVWLKDSISELVGKYHHEIGNMVRLSLTKLSDYELVGQIEEKVGNDLQYIRLNGAVVGGLVGMVIAIVKFLLFH